MVQAFQSSDKRVYRNLVCSNLMDINHGTAAAEFNRAKAEAIRTIEDESGIWPLGCRLGYEPALVNALPFFWGHINVLVSRPS